MTETRPEYMSNEELEAAWSEALEERFHLDAIPFDDESFADYHAELEAAEDRLLAIATEMEQRCRIRQPPVIQPPLPPSVS